MDTLETQLARSRDVRERFRAEMAHLDAVLRRLVPPTEGR